MAQADSKRDHASPQPSLIEDWLRDPASQRDVDPVMLEAWHTFQATARQRHEERQDRLNKGLATQARYGSWSIALGVLTFIGFASFSAGNPFSIGPDIASPSVALTRLLARFGPAILGLLLASYFFERAESGFSRVRYYESVLTFLSAMDIALCAAVTLRRGDAIERVVDRLVEARENGALSGTPRSVEGERAGASLGGNLIVRIMRVFLHRS